MFADQFEQFSSNLDALRAFVDFIEPILKSPSGKITENQRTVLLAMLCGLQKIDTENALQFEISEEDRQTIDRSFKFNVMEMQDGGKNISINIDGCDIEDPNLLITILKKIKRRSESSRFLYDSSLISLISTVEWFYSCLLHAYYEKYPHVAISADKVFSFEDLTRFSSIDDARRHIIERKVEGVLRGSFSDWINYFRKTLNISMSYLDDAFDDLVETCERRNLLVHNKGIINSIYLSNVKKKATAKLEKGTPIGVTRSYLDARISLFERCCILVGAELWKQIAPSDEVRGPVLTHIAYEHMSYKRWDIAEGLSYFVMNDKKLPERELMFGKMNYWLACKRQNKWSAVKAQVEQEDMSARDRLFQLAWFSLCERHNDFFRLLPAAVKAGDIDLEKLETFPIFDEIRNDKRFHTYRSKHATKKTSKKKNVKLNIRAVQ